MKNKFYFSFLLFICFVCFSNLNIAKNKFVLNFKNEIVNLDTLPKPFFLIFINSPSCTRCIESLDSALKSIKYNDKIILVLNSGIDAVSKRLNLINTKNYCDFDLAFFNVYDQKNHIDYNYESIFTVYNFKLSPSLLYVSEKGEHYFDYYELFKNTKTVSDIREIILSMIEYLK